MPDGDQDVSALSQTVADMGPTLKDVVTRVGLLNDQLLGLQAIVNDYQGKNDARITALEARVAKIESYLSGTLPGQITAGSVSFSP